MTLLDGLKFSGKIPVPNLFNFAFREQVTIFQKLIRKKEFIFMFG